MDSNKPKQVFGIIGGSGVYDIEGLSNKRWVRVDSSFGEPSDELMLGELNGQALVFLPRHGRGHKISPSEINFRANIDALKRAGVTDVISVSAVGSLREDLSLPDVPVVVGQLGEFYEAPFASVVNEQLAMTPIGISRIAFVNSHGLKPKSDNVHFDAAALREFGRRYAHGFLMLDPQWSK